MDDQNGKWTLKANDPKTFLKNHAELKLAIEFHPFKKPVAPGELVNTAVQHNFGQDYKTDTVKNNITPNPKPSEPTKNTPNTSYGEKPMGLILTSVFAGVVAITGATIYWFKKRRN